MRIEARDLSKIYDSGENRVVALDKASLEIDVNDFISIMGPSGSGKSTLLHLLSGLDRPTSGRLTYDGKDIYSFSDKELSAFRRQRIGFIFQQFNLLPVLTAKENIVMPVLGLNEYHEDVVAVYPAQASLKSGRLPDAPLEIALPEDVLHYLGFTGDLGDTVSLSLSKALRHGIEISSYDFTADFVLVGIMENNYLDYSLGGITGMVGAGTAPELLPDNYLYYNVDIRTHEKKTFQNTMLMYGKEARNRKQEIDRQHHTIPN